MTQCNHQQLLFQDLGGRSVVAQFDGGSVTSDAGGLLLREVEAKFAFIERFARCFTDHRDPDIIEHTVLELLKQRIFALCLGYEDLNDHDRLRHDPLLAVLVGKKHCEGNDRRRIRDRGKALAGKSTLNRLELTAARAGTDSRYKKIVGDLEDMQTSFADAFILQQETTPTVLILDLDATDSLIHGHQLGRFFHGYYDAYCYLPLYIFCGDHPLLALLRPSDIDACAGALRHVQRLVAQLRACWPNVKIILRGDSGFCREHLMRWCEDNNVDFLFGLAKNQRLLRILGKELHEAQEQFQQTGEPARVFKDFTYQTKKSWSRERRVVGKAEHLAKGANPRFVTTSLSAAEAEYAMQPLYEKVYCGRGNMENRIKEQQLYLFADRVSCATMRANQIRMNLSTMAYIVMRALRQFGLAETELAPAQCDTMRVKLLKVGAVIRCSVRRIYVALSEAYPFRELFGRVLEKLRALPPLPVPTPPTPRLAETDTG